MSSNEKNERPTCQSCSMPLETTPECGTDPAGCRVQDYCIYCFHKGAFTEPEMSRDEMVERVADHLMKHEHLAHMQARELADKLVSGLKRWRRAATSESSAHT
jgi:hypothetical protein